MAHLQSGDRVRIARSDQTSNYSTFQAKVTIEPYEKN